MNLPLSASQAAAQLDRIPWRKLAIVAVFLVTLLLVISFAQIVLAIFSPVASDPVADQAVLKEVQSQTLAADADLAKMGYTLQNGAGALLAGAGVTATQVASPTATATLAPTETPALPAWDYKGRVNILLMGLDGNTRDGRFRRADSIIVVSIDPATNSASMIGIPRDLYVSINSPKGVIRNRVNTAYVWGELYNYPGGGPALQMRTVGEVLGIPIHHYVSVYFDGFAKLIDAIGGIDIDVQQPIRDNFTGWTFAAGPQHLDGKRSLQFARSRYSTSDFSRGRRQQQVILAAVEKITKAGMLPKLPVILPAVAESFRSDMSIRDLLALAGLGYKIDRSSIKTAQVDETMCQSWRAPDGAAVLLPRWDRIKPMVQTALAGAAPVATPTTAAGASVTASSGDANPTATTAAATTAATTVAPAPSGYQTEQAKVEILNGTNTIGLARKTQGVVQGEGIQVIRIADASGIYKGTVLYTDASKPLTKDHLVKLLNIAPDNIKPLVVTPGGPNIRIILGNDLKLP
jgi:polyisoprenyl-teichoic acid--peptidoglycan teichoic acid transferase